MSVTIPSTGFLRLHQVLALVPVGKSSWWEDYKSGHYPKPVKLGPRTNVMASQRYTSLHRRLFPGCGER